MQPNKVKILSAKLEEKRENIFLKKKITYCVVLCWQGKLILDGREELSSSDALDFAANKDRFLS